MHKIVSTAGRLALAAGLIVTSFAGMATGTAMAQAKFPGYTSGVQIANLASEEATVTLVAYNPNGTQNGTTLVDTIPANSSKNYFPIKNVDAGFEGSMVVGSTKSVAGIVNLLAQVNNQYPAAAAYVGRSQGGTTVLLPLLNKDNSGFTTWYSIQNAGPDTATVNVAYSDGTSVPQFTIPSGASKVVYQSQETHSAKVFAGTVTSNQPLVASVVQESDKIMFAYTGFDSGSTNPVFPLINANNSGYITGLQIQNAGSAATDVTVTYTPSTAGTQCTETQTIQPGASGTFALAAFDAAAAANSNCAKGQTFIGSARVTGNSASQPLVGIGNQLKPNVNGEAYGAFDAAAAGKVVSMPLIMDRNSGFYTGFNVQNVGTSATAVTCTFQNNPRTVTATLQPGQALTDNQNNQLADKYVGSATCTGAAADAKLVGVVNELKPATFDNLLVYEGVSQP